MNPPTLEDMMGLVLFFFGLIMMITAFLAVLGMTGVIAGLGIPGFFVFGFLLCVAGFMMTRSASSGMFRRRQ